MGCEIDAASSDSRAPSSSASSPLRLCSTTLIATSALCHRPASREHEPYIAYVEKHMSPAGLTEQSAYVPIDHCPSVLTTRQLDMPRTLVHTSVAAAAQDGSHLDALQAALEPHLQQMLMVIAEKVCVGAAASCKSRDELINELNAGLSPSKVVNGMTRVGQGPA